MTTIGMPVAPALDALVRALGRARDGHDAWVAVHGPLRASELARLSDPTGEPGVSWRGPDGAHWRGVGAAKRWETTDGATALTLADACRQTLTEAVFGPPAALAMARGFGALAFDLHGPADGSLRGRFVLPRWLVRQTPDGATEGVALVPVWPLESPSLATARAEAAWWRMAAWAAGKTEAVSWPHVLPNEAGQPEWEARVTAALAAIADREVGKVVLARSIPLVADGPLPIDALYADLADQAPDTYRFMFHEGDKAFLGASPELLFHLAGDRVHTDALAGTVPRGADEADDAQLGQALLGSLKDRHEHGFVVEAITQALSPLAERVEVPELPTLRKLATVQHLHTPIAATLSGEISLAALIEAMHPTPAVGGTPREAAIELIRRLEGGSRGWYAGPVGWVSRDEAAFAVGIRSASVAGSTAAVWAGAGIVDGSVPALEWEETRRKAQPLVRLLAGEEATR